MGSYSCTSIFHYFFFKQFKTAYMIRCHGLVSFWHTCLNLKLTHQTYSFLVRYCPKINIQIQLSTMSCWQFVTYFWVKSLEKAFVTILLCVCLYMWVRDLPLQKRCFCTIVESVYCRHNNAFVKSLRKTGTVQLLSHINPDWAIATQFFFLSYCLKIACKGHRWQDYLCLCYAPGGTGALHRLHY